MTPAGWRLPNTTSSPATADEYWAMIRQGDYHLALGQWNGGADPDTWLWSLFHDNHIFSQWVLDENGRLIDRVGWGGGDKVTRLTR